MRVATIGGTLPRRAVEPPDRGIYIQVAVVNTSHVTCEKILARPF